MITIKSDSTFHTIAYPGTEKKKSYISHIHHAIVFRFLQNLL